MTEEARTKDLTRERTKAVRQARKNEKQLVKEGKGTRDWSPSEQKEWIRTGRCKGYEGHHMKNVKEHPEYAGDPKNIQFLNKSEHLQAHGGDYANVTNGYYNPKTGRMSNFRDTPPHAPTAKPLSEPLSERSKKINETKRLKAQQQKQEARKRAEEIKARQSEKNKVAYKSKTLQREEASGIKNSASEKNRSKTLERERKAASSATETAATVYRKKHSEKH